MKSRTDLGKPFPDGFLSCKASRNAVEETFTGGARNTVNLSFDAIDAGGTTEIPSLESTANSTKVESSSISFHRSNRAN